MINLNELKRIALENAEKRQENGANISTDTRKMLKHCATEVIEAMEAYNIYCYVDWHCGMPTEKDNWTGLTQREARKRFSSELADIVCCCLIIAEKEDIDIERAIYDCIEKNERRANGIGDKL